MIQKYSELKPERLQALLTSGAPLIWPWGALEWHGAHLPLGLDGIVAEAFAAQLAERVGGVLLPGCWLPITTLPHPLSLQISTETLRRILDESIAGFVKAGAKRVVIVTGHYAQGHEVELYEAALRAMDIHNIRVFCSSPLEILSDEYLDHAGRFEVSQLLAIRPDLVDLTSLPQELSSKRDAVLGAHPNLGSAEEGVALTAEALHRWEEWLSSDAEALKVHYRTAIDRYSGYVEKFKKDSWEDAIHRWWATKD